MTAWRHLFPAALPITACLLVLCSCRATDRIPCPDRVSGFDGLSKLYRTSTAPHRRAFRKPVRDERAEAMRLLADKAGRMADQARAPLVAPAVTDAGATVSAKEHEAVAAYRASLRNLETAARRRNVAAVRSSYIHVAYYYRLLNDVRNPPTTNR